MKPAGRSFRLASLRLATGALSAVTVPAALFVTAVGALTVATSAPAGEGPPRESGATDTVFLVDSSGSNFRSDPTGVRKLLIEAFTTFAWDRPGDRIAIGQFAGWGETSRNEENVVLRLSGIPKGEQERAEFIEGLRAALQKMRPFGVGTDPNAALDLMLSKIEKERGAEDAAREDAAGEGAAEGAALEDIITDTAAEGAEAAGNKLWAVMITDGDVNVIEGATARDVYVERAQEKHGATTPETLALVASEIFFNETLPRLKERGVTVTPVSLGCKEGEAGPFFDRVKEAVGIDALCVDGPLLGRTFTGLLKSCPGRPPSESTDYGYSRATLEPGAEHRIPFRVLPETRRTRAAFFGSSGGYQVAAAGAGGGELKAAAAPKDRTGGKGLFRILEFTAAEPGDYEFVVRNTSEGPLEIEVTLYPEVALEVALDDEEGVFTTPAGLPFTCAVSVLGGEGEVVKNPASLPELNVALSVSGALEPDEALFAEDLAEEISQEVTFGELPRAETAVELAVGKIGADTRRLTARLRAFPVKGEDGQVRSYIYEGPLETFELRLLPAVAVNFGFAEAFAGQVVPLEGRFTVPVDLPPPEIATALDPETSARLKRVTDDKGDRYQGSITFPGPGEWRVSRKDAPDLLVVPGDLSAVSVRERRMRLLSAEPPHDELKTLEFTVRFCEKAGVAGSPVDAYGLPVVVELDVGPGEVAEFAASSFQPSEELAQLGIESPFEIKLDHLAEPAAGEGRVAAKVLLSVTTDEALPRKPGSADLHAKVGETELAKSVEVSLVFSDFWQKMILMTWYYWGPALLVLLLVLWWLMLARFKMHELYIVSRLEQATEPAHLLRALCEGSKRHAYGTPEVQNVAQFRIRGTKLLGGRVSVRALREGAMVAANGVEASNWVRLRHGDEVIAENPEGAYCRYWYFDRPPTEDELQRMLAADAVELGPDEFVVEGL